MWNNWMIQALEQARLASSEGDAPFGCIVLDRENNLVWQDRDRVSTTCDPTAHAEINAVRAICSKLGKTKLDGYTFVTTSEPCPTCLSALIRVRAKLCVFGAPIEEDASLPICSRELAAKATKHQIELIGGILQDQCLKERSAYFSERAARQAA
jgi:tRNA(adenine34) deaminase